MRKTVRVDGLTSDYRSQCVPHCYLGLLFSLYVHDDQKALKESYMYADDLQINVHFKTVG